MGSSVNRQRRKKAFSRGYDRPQTLNPYKNPVLDALWKRGKEARLKKTGGVMPLPPQRKESRASDSHSSKRQGRRVARIQPPQQRGVW
jgi:hypothetical protein